MAEFTVTEYYELLALHRMLVEAKFNPDPEDRDIAASPFATTLFDKLLEALQQAEVDRGQAPRAEQWKEWRRVDRNGRFWKAALAYAAKRQEWGEWDIAEKEDYVRRVLSPFEANDEEVSEFIEAVG